MQAFTTTFGHALAKEDKATTAEIHAFVHTLSPLSMTRGTDHNILYHFEIRAAGDFTFLDELRVPTGGTYQGFSLKENGFKLWTSTANNFAGATLLSEVGGTGSGEQLFFSELNHFIAENIIHYFWLTADISTGAAVGQSIQVRSMGSSHVFFSDAVLKDGFPLPDGATHTIVNTPVIGPHHVTNFRANMLTPFHLQLGWDDVEESPIPDGYLVLGALDSSNFRTVSDGAPIPDDTDFYDDGRWAFNAMHVGLPNGFDIMGLETETWYYFKIIPYRNQGSTRFYNTSGDMPTIAVKLFLAPTLQASNIQFSNRQAHSMTVTFANGNGNGRLVIAREGTSVSAQPADLVNYTASSEFGTGEALSSGQFAVYSGHENSFTVTNLNPATFYHFRVFEYKSFEGNTLYLRNTASGNPANRVTLAAEPAAPPSNLVIRPLSATTNRVTFSPSATPVPPTGYLVVRRLGSPTPPSDGTAYSVGSSFSNQLVVYNGADTTFQDNDLVPGGVYSYDVYAYNGTSITLNYLQNPPLTINYMSPLEAPTLQASNLMASLPGTNTMTLSWIPGNGTRSMVIGKKGGGLTSFPENFQEYPFDLWLSNGFPLGDDTYVAYVGDQSTITISGLVNFTDYDFAVFSLNGSGQLVNYLFTFGTNRTTVKTLDLQPTQQPIDFKVASRTHREIQIQFDWNPITAPPNGGFIALRRPLWITPSPPLDAQIYTLQQTIGQQTVVHVGPDMHFSDTTVAAGTTYAYDIYSFNGSGTGTNYLTLNPLMGQATTLATPPAAGPWPIQVTLQNSTSIHFRYTQPPTLPESYLVLLGMETSEVPEPEQGTSYAPGDFIGDFRVMYAGKDTAHVFQGLDRNTSYQLMVLAFNGSGSTSQYFLPGQSLTFFTDNSAPTDIVANRLWFMETENTPVFITRIQALDIDHEDTHLYSLVPEDGTAYPLFAIQGDSLILTNTVNFRGLPTAMLRVRADDQQGGQFEKYLNFQVVPLPLDPVDSTSMLSLRQAIGSQMEWKEGTHPGTWAGVKIAFGRIRSLDLSGKGLTQLPSAPILALTALTDLSVGNNHLYFDHLLPLAHQAMYFGYTPQTLENPVQTLTRNGGETLNISLARPVFPKLTYQWWHNSTPIEQANGPTLIVAPLTKQDEGLYIIQVTSPDLPDLVYTVPHTELFIADMVTTKDSLALLTVLQNLGGLSFSTEEPASTWPGVYLSGGRVTAIALNSMGLTGQISPAIGELTALTRLELFDNALSGAIPPTLGNLAALTYLDLDNNQLTGPVPSTFCNLTELQTLWLSRNQLTALPECWGNLEKLENLFLHQNQFTELPASLANLEQMVRLSAGNNQLVHFNYDLGNWYALQNLDLAGNQISEIHPSLGQLPELQRLNLGSNALQKFPANFQVTAIAHVNVANNMLGFAALEGLQAQTGHTLLFTPQRQQAAQLDTLIQEGASIVFHSHVDGKSTQYQWKKNGSVLSGSQFAQLSLPSFTAQDIGSYVCEATHPQFPGLVRQSATFHAFLQCPDIAPPVIQNPFSTTFCSGTPVYAELTVAVEGTVSYQWRRNGQRLALAESSRFVAFEPGVYDVLCIREDGCSFLSAPLALEVLPVAPVSIALQENMELVLQNPVPDGAITWFLNGVPLTHEAGNVLAPTQSGNYRAGVMQANGCQALSNTLLVTVTHAPEQHNTAPAGVQVWPNPAGQEIWVDVPFTQGPSTLRLLNLQGKVCSTAVANNGTQRISLEQLPAGIYFVEVQAGNVVYRQKLVKN